MSRISFTASGTRVPPSDDLVRSALREVTDCELSTAIEPKRVREWDSMDPVNLPGFTLSFLLDDTQLNAMRQPSHEFRKVADRLFQSLVGQGIDVSSRYQLLHTVAVNGEGFARVTMVDAQTSDSPGAPMRPPAPRAMRPVPLDSG